MAQLTADNSQSVVTATDQPDIPMKSTRIEDLLNQILLELRVHSMQLAALSPGNSDDINALRNDANL